MVDLNCRLVEFTNMHNHFLADWNEAMKTGDTTSLDRMTENYYVAFFKSSTEKPMFFNKEESLSGMSQSVHHFLGAKKRFENRIIRMRTSVNAVVFYELLIEKNDEILARLFATENWMLIDGNWMITRETEESIH